MNASCRWKGVILINIKLFPVIGAAKMVEKSFIINKYDDREY